jgi:hypothetical protein
MRTEEEIRQRIKLWKEYKRRHRKWIAWNFYHEEKKNPHPEKILEKLGYTTEHGDHLIDDPFYDGDCADVIIKELKWILGEGDKE